MEYWDIYDKDGHFTGRKKGKYEKWGEDEYHLATEGWIILPYFLYLVAR